MKRLDRLEIATVDLADAAAAYERNFGFSVRKSPDGASATIAIGDAEIRLRSGPAVAELIQASGEGMMALYLEADDLGAVEAALRKAGLEPGAIRIEDNRRVLAIDPKISSRVTLFIFDRKV
ncbi:MAG: VOC family protein [Candidatus Binataceae bacterium]